LEEIYEFEVRITISYYFEKTNETDIYIHLNLDGTGKSKIETGMRFFICWKIARHGQMDLKFL
jgi:imidazoleglycerol-phosphate dehydratase/histidinol-phosphatase